MTLTSYQLRGPSLLLPDPTKEDEASSGVTAVDVAEMPVDPASIWEELTSGSLRVTGHQNTDRCCYVELERRAPQERQALAVRHRQLLERLLLGQCAKVVALESGNADSTISCLLSQALRALGVSTGPRQMPLFLVMLVRASLPSGRTDVLDTRIIRTDAKRCLLILRREDAALMEHLSSAEREVIRAVVDGFSQNQIAERRDTSPRTVANQVASAYAKLRLSGRLALLSALAQASVAMTISGAR